MNIEKKYTAVKYYLLSIGKSEPDKLI